MSETQAATGETVPVVDFRPSKANFEYRYNHYDFYTTKDGDVVAVSAR